VAGFDHRHAFGVAPIAGLTGKPIGKQPAISPRTVDVYRARSMRKHRARTAHDLGHRLLAA
jgi:FixJ family two-component response regulator